MPRKPYTPYVYAPTAPLHDLRPWKVPDLNVGSGNFSLIAQIGAETGLNRPNFNAKWDSFVCAVASWKDTLFLIMGNCIPNGYGNGS